jgi:hypothetical protein
MLPPQFLAEALLDVPVDTLPANPQTMKGRQDKYTYSYQS